jgi:hypothetical protein
MESLKQAEQFVSTKMAIIKTLYSLILLEARLARLSIFPLLMNLCMLLVILMSLWILTSILIGYGILLAFNSLLISFLLVLALNVIIFLSLVKYLTYNVKNISFEKTQAYFSNKMSADDESR